MRCTVGKWVASTKIDMGQNLDHLFVYVQDVHKRQRDGKALGQLVHGQLSPEQLVETLVSCPRRESHIEPARKPVKRKRPDAQQLPAASGCDSTGFVATDYSENHSVTAVSSTSWLRIRPKAVNVKLICFDPSRLSTWSFLESLVSHVSGLLALDTRSIPQNQGDD